MRIICCLLMLFPAPFIKSQTLENNPNLLFFADRSLNSNQVVYEANFDSLGQLCVDEPIKYYWLLYEEEGQREELSYMENEMAYGLEFHKKSSCEFQVKLKADKSMKIILKQTAPFHAQIYVHFDSGIINLKQIYIKAKKSLLIPKVEYLQFIGIDPENQQNISLKEYY